MNVNFTKKFLLHKFPEFKFNLKESRAFFYDIEEDSIIIGTCHNENARNFFFMKSLFHSTLSKKKLSRNSEYQNSSYERLQGNFTPLQSYEEIHGILSSLCLINYYEGYTFGIRDFAVNQLKLFVAKIKMSKPDLTYIPINWQQIDHINKFYIPENKEKIWSLSLDTIKGWCKTEKFLKNNFKDLQELL